MNKYLNSSKIQNIKEDILAHKKMSLFVALVLLTGGYYVHKHLTSTTGETKYLVANVSKGTITSSVSGTGQISASNQVDIKSKVSGDITHVYVGAGQSVSQGDLIADVDPTDAEISLESAEIAYEKLTKPATPADVQSAQNSLDKSYNDAWNAVSGSFTDLPDIMIKMNDVFYSTSGYLNKVKGSNSVDDSLKADIIDAGSSFDASKVKYQNVLNEYNSLSRSSATSSILKLANDTDSMLKSVSDAIKNTQSTISLIIKNEADTSTQATTAASNANSWLGTVSGDLSSVLSAESSIQNSQKSLDVLVQGADSLDVRSEKLSLQQKQNTYADYFIRAPFSGLIGKMDVKVGDSASGATIATLISPQYIALVSLNEVDAVKVKTGDKAVLTFDAIDGLDLTGVVSEIDLVGTVSQGVVSYSAKIVLDATDARIRPGMSVSAEIITDVKQDVLSVPSSAVKSDAQGSYVLEFDSPITPTAGSAGTPSSIVPHAVSVEVGISNDTSTEIISGINEGDQVVTRIILPTTTTTSSTPSLLGGGNTRGATGGVRALGR